jgi:glycosyltransferase involved in cell wall biosynthesis
MVKKFYRSYQLMKKALPWQAKALAKGAFLALQHKKAVPYYRTHEADFSDKSFQKDTVKKEKISILFVVPHLVFGGAERILFDTICELQKNGINCAVACAVKEGEWAGKFKKIVEVYDLGRADGGFGAQKDALVDLVNRVRPDIVQMSNCEILEFAFPYLKAKTAAATVNWVHIDAEYFKLTHCFGRKDFTKAIDRTIVPTESMKRFLARGNYLPVEKIEAIGDGIDLSIFDPGKFAGQDAAIKGKYHIPRDCPVVSFVGRLTAEKDPLTFVKVAQRVAARCPRAIFVVAGQGFLFERMVKLAAKLKISDKIKFLGFCDRIPELLSVSSVFVSTSRTEGFGLNAAEAMAMGVPAVVSDVGGLKELVAKDCGFRAKPRDLNDFSEKIGGLLDNNDLRKDMGQKSRARIESEFSIQKTTQKLISVYRQLI